MRAIRVLTWLVIVSAADPAARACTTFCFGNGGSPVFGKNYDWNVEAGMLVVNPAGVEKQALTADGRPARWVSRHGSVTFNQYGREFPSGGMNARGLVLELMWLGETEYPAPDARPAVPTLQWIQYQLDRSATVDEVVASDRDVRIAPDGSAKIHFLVADAGGDVAAIEFVGGRMLAYRGADLPYPVLTNDAYPRSVQYARRSAAPAAASRLSLDRFARAARSVDRRKATTSAAAVAEAFEVLAGVAQGEHTRWSIVYEIGERRVHFRTRANRALRWLDLDALEFGCAAPARIADLALGRAGDLSADLVPYTTQANRALVLRAFAETEFLRGVPARSLEELATYPDGQHCAP